MLANHVSKNVARVGRNEIDGIRRIPRDLVYNVSDKARVGLHKVEPGLSRLDSGTRRDHDNVRILRVGIVTRAEISRPPDGRRMSQIEHLPLGSNGIDVDQDNLNAGNAVTSEECSGASYETRTNDSNFMLCDHRDLLRDPSHVHRLSS